MLGNILGIDISDSAVSAVLVACGLKTDRMVACAAVSLRDGVDAPEALDLVLKKIMAPNVVLVTGISARQLSFRNLTLPFSDEKSIRKTLKFELENMLPYGVEDIVADFIITGTGSGKTEMLSASVAGDWLFGHLEFLKKRGLEPDLLEIRNVPVVSQLLRRKDIPDAGIFLEIQTRNCTLILFSTRRVVLVRTFTLGSGELLEGESALASLCHDVRKTIKSLRYGIGIECIPQKVFISGLGAVDPAAVSFVGDFFALEAETVDLCSTDLQPKSGEIAGEWNPFLMNNALALALNDNKQAGFNFLRGRFSPKKQFARYKKEIIAGVVYGLVFLTLLAVDAVIDRSALENKTAALDKQIMAVFSQTFPDVKRVVSPVRQMRVKMMALKKGSADMPLTVSNVKVIDLLEDISRRISDKLEIQVNRMVLDQESVIIKGKTDTFNTVDSIKKELAASIYYDDVTISSANLARSGKGVRFELKLARNTNTRR